MTIIRITGAAVLSIALGLYGDGQYPGSIDDNMGPPYLGRW